MDEKKGLFDKMRELGDLAEQIWNEGKRQPLSVSVMGQTGVGKSSLINALFNTELDTDPVRPVPPRSDPITQTGTSGHPVSFYDLPGIGESELKDEEYIERYNERLKNSDVTIWAILADSRSFVFDSSSLKKILDTIVDSNEKTELMSRIIFVLTKVDLLSPKIPSPWILAKMREGGGVFKPQAPILDLIEQKEEHFRKVVIGEFGQFIRGQTYCSENFNVGRGSKMRRKGRIVYYEGSLAELEEERSKTSSSKHKKILDRLFDDSYRVIPCSAHFRYNLNLLMRVIVDRLRSRSAGRFGAFVNTGLMSTIDLSLAKQYRNMILLDEQQGMKLDIADVAF